MLAFPNPQKAAGQKSDTSSPQEETSKSILSTLEAIKKHLDDWSYIRAQRPFRQLFVLTEGYPVTFDAHGFRYSAFVLNDSDDGTTLTVNVGGVVYTQTLSKGLNQVNIPDGADITASKTVTVYMILANHQYKTS